MKKLLIILSSCISLIIAMAVSASAAETMYVANVDYWTYLCKAPASDDYYSEIPIGTKVQSVGWQKGSDGAGYNEVIWNGTKGWIKTQYLSYIGYDNVNSRYFKTWYDDSFEYRDGYKWYAYELSVYKSGNNMRAKLEKGRGKGVDYVIGNLSFINGSTAVAYGYYYVPAYERYSDPLKFTFEFYSNHVYLKECNRETGEFLWGIELY